MAITYKYIDPPATPEKGVQFMQDTLLPLLREYWQKKGKELYNKDMNFNVLTFVQMWFLGSLVPVIAYEDDKPVGFFIGVRFVPILYDANTLQAEVWYAPTPEIEQGMFDYLMTIIGFMNINEIRIETTEPHAPSIPWRKVDTAVTTRHIKE